MKLINFLLCLSVGAVIGWFASQIAAVEHTMTHARMHRKDHSPEKG